jgi:hypothetical protein
VTHYQPYSILGGFSRTEETARAISKVYKTRSAFSRWNDTRLEIKILHFSLAENNIREEIPCISWQKSIEYETKMVDSFSL